MKKQRCDLTKLYQRIARSEPHHLVSSVLQHYSGRSCGARCGLVATRFLNTMETLGQQSLLQEGTCESEAFCPSVAREDCRCGRCTPVSFQTL
jgi:hypothetical protein